MPPWLQSLFQAIDRKDTDGVVAHLTDDVRFRYGSAPPVAGRAAVRDAVAGFFATLASVSHRLIATWEEPDAVICEGEVTYALPGGRRVTLPFLNVLRMEGERVKDYRIYLDPTPLAS